MPKKKIQKFIDTFQFMIKVPPVCPKQAPEKHNIHLTISST